MTHLNHKSPLAPASFPDMPSIAGVRLATFAAGINSGSDFGITEGSKADFKTGTNADTNAGIQSEAKPDLFCASLVAGTNVAATFTRSKCPSAAVEWCQNLIRENTSARAVVCNSGNANAFTGAAGTKSTELMAQIVAKSLAVSPHEVYVASTGVIGEPLPNEKLQQALPQLVKQLAVPSTPAWERAANAICTTDTFPKAASKRIDKSRAQIAGMAKGSGMIAPDMATLLAFVFTDMAVEPTILQNCLSLAVKRSFNRITIDSDTSTSDTVLLFATGATNEAEIASSSDARLPLFQDALDQVLVDLAQQVVRDGEGATKFVEVTVRGAQSNQAAHNIARAIAESPLVSTALAAEDANWGRIVMAVGKAGEKANRDRLAIWIGDELVAQHGAVHPTYSERTATEHLQQDEVRIVVDIGIADGSETIWTCDLTHGYIAINAGYRT